ATPTRTPPGATCRSPPLTHPSNCTRVHSPLRLRTRSGVSVATVPASGPSGTRYSVVIRTGWARLESEGVGGWGAGAGGRTAWLSAAWHVSAEDVATVPASGGDARRPTQPSRLN